MAKRAQGQQRPPKKTVIVGVRMDESLAQRLQALADQEDRPLSNFLNRVLKEYVAQIDGQK